MVDRDAGGGLNLRGHQEGANKHGIEHLEKGIIRTCMKPGPKSIGRGGARKNAGRPTLDPNGERRSEKITSVTPREKAWLLERLKEYRAANGELEDW